MGAEDIVCTPVYDTYVDADGNLVTVGGFNCSEELPPIDYDPTEPPESGMSG